MLTRPSRELNKVNRKWLSNMWNRIWQRGEGWKNKVCTFHRHISETHQRAIGKRGWAHTRGEIRVVAKYWRGYSCKWIQLSNCCRMCARGRIEETLGKEAQSSLLRRVRALRENAHRPGCLDEVKKNWTSSGNFEGYQRQQVHQSWVHLHLLGCRLVCTFK